MVFYINEVEDTSEVATCSITALTIIIIVYT